MAISYTWDVSICDVYPTKNSKSNVVYAVHWKLKAIDDANNDANGRPQQALAYGKQLLDTSDLSNFTNWSSLDAAKVQGWVETALNSTDSNYVTNIKATLDAEIAEKVSPTSVQKTLG
jgi:hypothetical protein